MMKSLMTSAAVCFACGIATASDPRPNIVFILADDVGIGDIKCFHDRSRVMTPNIDKLASDGMRFTHAYAPGSVCSPTRYALMTGAYPCRGPLRDRSSTRRSSLAINVETVTLPSFLKSHGYRTACIGKWHLGFGKNGVTNWAAELRPGGLEIGFDYQFVVPANHNDGLKSYVENHRLLWLKDGVTELPDSPTAEQLLAIRYDDEVDSTLTAKAIEFMRQKNGKPFFVYLSLVATPTHVTPQQRFRGTSEIGQLGDYIGELDFHVGEIIVTLEELGLADNTIVFFSSDNGGQLDDHPSAGKNLNLRDQSGAVAEKSRTAKTDARLKFGHRTNGSLRGGKGSVFEGGIRVPFIVRWPGKIPPGIVTKQMISLADVFATSASLIGERLPESAAPDSMDLSPVMLGKDTGPIRTAVISQNGHGLLAFRDGDWKLCMTKVPEWNGGHVIFPVAPYRLFNLAKDPHETADVSQKYPDRAKAMKAKLLSLIQKGQSHEVQAR